MKLVWFFALGALAMLVARASETPELTVRVAATASFDEVARTIDDAVALELGLALGWRSDPIIVDRLERDLRSAGIDGARPMMMALAANLDLLRRDPLVRARLIARAQAQLARFRAPSDGELDAYRLAHRDRFERPTLYRVRHDGPSLTLPAAAVRTEAQLVAALGPDARTLIRARRLTRDRDRYQVLEVMPATLPPLSQIRAAVEGAWREEAGASARGEALREARARVRVRLEVVE